MAGSVFTTTRAGWAKVTVSRMVLTAAMLKTHCAIASRSGAPAENTPSMPDEALTSTATRGGWPGRVWTR
ncbi:hypothetical protein D3C72_1240550 [compost metagenome]